MKDYYKEKSKFYYDMFLKQKLVKKVCAFIVDKDKFLVLVKNGEAINIGGSVEFGEKAKDAIKREIYEECNGIVLNTKYITKRYYSIDWEYENEKFPNKRVEYFYLCELENNNVKLGGLNGEFGADVKLKWVSLSEFEKLKHNQNEFEIMEKVIKQ